MRHKEVRAQKRRRIQLKVKRLFDVIVSVAILFLFLPVWVAVAAVIKMTSKGPVFFIQERPGYHKRLSEFINSGQCSQVQRRW